MSTEILNDLEIQEALAHDSGGRTLYRARRRSVGRTVAFKVLDESVQTSPDRVARFRQEAHVLAGLKHGNIAEILGTGTWKGRIFCASEWIEGEDLGRQLERGCRFTTEEILHIAQGVAHALRAAWKHEILHGDIKPSNIILTPQGIVKVTDFGAAEAQGAAPSGSAGSEYLSPEQGLGQPVDIRSDIYSLGAVLYRLAAGRPPFDGYDSLTSLIYQLAHVAPRSPRELGSSIPKELERLILRCLAKSPEERYQTPADLIAELQQVRTSLATPKVLPTGKGGEEDSGNFDIYEDQIIGEGGMGTLYRGRQRSLDRAVAVKVIREVYTTNPEFVERFRREAELLAQISHANVVQIFGTGIWKGRLFYAMELVEGQDLASRQKAGHRFTSEEILRVADGVGQALRSAWKFKIVHRDIKPSNILLSTDGTIKVADFGLAKSLRIPRTDSQIIAGTAEYLSPEQGLGHPVDIRSDIYSLGVVLYELAAGRPPFQWTGSSIQLIYQHVHAKPPPLDLIASAVPQPLKHIIHRCLAKKPEERYQSPEELLKDIQAGLRGSGVAQRPRTSSRRPAYVLSGAAVLVLLAGASFFFIPRGRKTSTGPKSEAALADYRLALGLGDYSQAMKIAEERFGPDSEEFQKAHARQLDRTSDEWEAKAREQVRDRDWAGAVESYEVLLKHAPAHRRAGLDAALGYCRDLLAAQACEARKDWAGALDLYRKYEAMPFGDATYVRESIGRVQRALESNGHSNP